MKICIVEDRDIESFTESEAHLRQVREKFSFLYECEVRWGAILHSYVRSIL